MDIDKRAVIGCNGPMDLLRNVEYFVAVATERHFGRAADELGMTQPPLSQGLRRLEQRWGLRLLERSARDVTLTEAGRALLPSAQALLEHAADLEAEAAALERGRPTARIALPFELGPWIPTLVGALQGALDDRELHPRVLPTSRCVPTVAAGELDLAVVRHPSVIDGCAASRVSELPSGVVVSAGVAAGRLGELDLPLAAPPHVDHPAAHDQLVDALRRQGHSGATAAVRSDEESRALTAAARSGRLAVALDHSGLAGPGERLLATEPDLTVRVRVVARKIGPDLALVERLTAVLDAVLP